MKTIKDLNNKMWYRLIKVLYLLLSLFITLIIGAIVQENNDVLRKISSNDIFLSEDLKNFKQETKTLSKQEKDKLDSNIRNLFIDGKISDSEYRYKLMILRNKPVSNIVIHLILTYISILPFMYIVFFQLLNRIFYYVVLGNFNPKKE